MNPGTYLLLLVLGTIAGAIVLVRYRDLIVPVNNSGAPGRRPAVAAGAGAGAPGRRRSRRPGRTRHEHVQTEERQHNAQSGRVQGSGDRVQGSDVLAEQESSNEVVMSADELKRLTLAIVIYTQTRNEQTALESAFECTKGGSKRWKRAKHLFALAAVPADQVQADQVQAA